VDRLKTIIDSLTVAGTQITETFIASYRILVAVSRASD